MEKRADKSLLQYSIFSYDEVKKCVFDVLKKNKYSSDSDEENISFYVGRMADAFVEEEKKENFEFSEEEKSIISLFDISLLQELVLIDKTQGIDVSERKIKLENELSNQLKLICSYLGITFESVSSYSLDEVGMNFVDNESKLDPLRVTRTFKELGRNEESKEFCEKLVSIIEKSQIFQQQKYSWQDVFFISLLAQTVYSKFSFLSEESQNFLMKTFFIRPLFFSASVRIQLQNILRRTNTPVSYTTKNQMLFECISQNKEQIINESKLFSDFMKDYFIFAGNNWDKQKKQDEFITSLQVLDENGVRILKEALSITVHLKNADLVENNNGGELSIAEQYKNDVIKLVYLFGIGKDSGGSEIIKYFSQENPRVSLNSFLKRLYEICDLKNDAAIGNISEFTEVLHENKFLLKDQELIIFNETDDQFHWNEELIK
jgi:hypothetical protein